MQTSDRSGIGRAVAAVAVIVVIVVAGGLGFALTSKGTHSTTSSSLSTSSIVTSSTTNSTQSSSSAFTNTTSVTSSTTTSTSTGCTFSQASPEIVKNSTSNYFTGCLTPGTTGVYLLAVVDPNGIVVQGVIKSQYAMGVTFAGTPVDNLSAAAKGAQGLTANDTTVVPMSDLSLRGSSGYSITFVNESDQNNTIIVNLTLIDFYAFEG
jgi:hypothetical protein